MEFLREGILSITWQQIVMYLTGGLLIWLAIKKQYEPALLLPMGFGAILVNLPGSNALTQEMQGIGEVQGIVSWLYDCGIAASEALPLLLFIGIGAMIDFGPLLAKPWLFLFGIAAQLGIPLVFLAARELGFSPSDAASIGIIGAADGPTALLVSQVLHSRYIGAIAVAAYSYMALVPIIQPFAIRLITTKKERCIAMPYESHKVSQRARILFPIFATLIAGILAPSSASLVGFLMFGNLIKECGVLHTLSEAAQTTLTNLITLLLGITISAQLQAESFVRADTLFIMGMGLVAFVFDTFGGVLMAKFLNLFLKQKINPMIGAAGISAFPMSSRVVQKLAQEEAPGNIVIMHAAGANVAGQIASAVIGGLLIQLVSAGM